MTRATLATILGAPWPALEDLELWFGDPQRGYGADCGLVDVVPLFGCELPRLRVLALRNAMFSDEIVPDILSWPGAAQLVAGKHALPKLARLGVFECSLSLRGLAILRDAGFHVDDRAIAPAFAWRDPQQKSGRHATVNE